MADVFLSYRRDESRIAVEELARVLERTGWTVWYAPKTRVADPLKIILGELDAARCVVGLWSENATSSIHVVQEFDLARKSNKLLALETDGAKLPPQYLDRIAGKLTNLNRMTYGPELAQLLAGLAQILGLPPGFSSVDDLVTRTLDNGFGFFKLGNMTIPARSLLGIPRAPLAPSDVAIEFEDVQHEARETYPKVLNAVYEDLLNRTFARHGLLREKLRDNPLARLDWWDQAPEGEDDSRGVVTLHFSKTSYFRIWATNDAIDMPFFEPGQTSQTTIRKSFCYAPYSELSHSVLADNPGVEVVFISDTPTQSPQRQVLIRRRSMRSAGYKGWYQVSASGHMSLAHRDDDGTHHRSLPPSPKLDRRLRIASTSNLKTIA